MPDDTKATRIERLEALASSQAAAIGQLTKAVEKLLTARPAPVVRDNPAPSHGGGITATDVLAIVRASQPQPNTLHEKMMEAMVARMIDPPDPLAGLEQLISLAVQVNGGEEPDAVKVIRELAPVAGPLLLAKYGPQGAGPAPGTGTGATAWEQALAGMPEETRNALAPLISQLSGSETETDDGPQPE